MKKRSSYLVLPLPFTLIVFLSLPLFVFAWPRRVEVSRKEFSYDGLNRSYFLHLPAQYESYKSLPVLVALHGGGRADGDEMAEQSGFNDIADREGFIAVYPNGVDAQWNDGRGRTFRGAADNTHIDDVGFISSLIDHMIRSYKGDPNRIYVTGVSNGGMMTLRLACEMASKLTAIAPVIASMPKNIADTCAPDSPLPLLLMNGTEDPIIPWEGGSVKNFRRSYGEVISTDSTVQFWAKHNKCRLSPKGEGLPDLDRDDGSRVQVTTYRNLENSCEVILYSIEGGGHNFPGSNTADRPRLVGKKNNDIAGPEVIWKFFMHYTK